MRAVVFGAEHFHKYIYVRDFTIETVHNYFDISGWFYIIFFM